MPGLRPPWQRFFRCRTSVAPPVEPLPMSRFDEFVSLHESLTTRPKVDLRRVWACGVGTAFIAAGMMFTGVLLLRGLFGIAVPVGGSGLDPEPAAATYATFAGAATLQTTALLHILAVAAARPVRAFCWIGGLAVLMVSLLPLTLRGSFSVAAATGLLNLVGGCVVVALLATLTTALLRRRDPPPPPSPPRHPLLPGGW
ncbi:DUF6069 family protein [Spirillospora sp. NPDC048911]|uniref:DUF6069 family protein n=1 Tax=Spirillospora sp. NPDC048911 TaxID=3364527 RepID=UPI0037207E8C